MKHANKTKEQLIDELAKLQQENIELKLALKCQENLSAKSACLSPSHWFSTGKDEMTFSKPPEPQQTANQSIKYKFSDLVDVPFIQQLLNSFSIATGIPHSLNDEDGNVLSGAGWQKICTQFHRICPQTACRCKQSDSYIATYLHEGPYIGYKCMNGLMDYAAPIFVEGQHLATIFLGQLLHELPDEDCFRRQALEYGFDEAAYMEMLSRVPIIPAEHIEAIMEFYSRLGRVLATMGLERKRQLEAADQTIRGQQEALLQSEEKFYKAFHFNPDPMSITTLKEGLYVQVNDAYLKASGYREHEVIGHTVWELDIWAVSEERDIIIKQIQECGKINNVETKFRTKSGEIVTALMSAEVMDIDGEAHLLVTTKDITERKTMEEALRLSEECFSKAFNASPIIMGIATFEEERLIKVNRAFCRVTGYSSEEATGKSTLELGFWSDPATRNVVKQKLTANQSIQEMEICFCRKTGEQRVGLFSAERLDVNGESCILGLLSDITELRQMEVEMTRLDRLNVVGEMAASIGHEIRNPMTTVRGYLQLLQQNKDYHQEIEYFDLMIEELDSANSIITEFLSLAKNKMVEMKLKNLNAIINKSLLLIQANAMSRDKHIKLELHDLPNLLLDKKEIRQLILNLVNNGMESMSSAGDVTIRTNIEQDKVVLAVQDEGDGIDSEILNKIGTPFFTTKEQGTGLGLAVCYRIAARHNAKIDIETSSTGTTFYVRFPIPTVETGFSETKVHFNSSSA